MDVASTTWSGAWAHSDTTVQGQQAVSSAVKTDRGPVVRWPSTPESNASDINQLTDQQIEHPSIKRSACFPLSVRGCDANFCV